MLLGLLELESYYLSMPRHVLIWTALRVAFSVSWVVCACVSCYLLILNGLWLIIASLMQPTKVLPYAVSMTGLPRACACVRRFDRRSGSVCGVMWFLPFGMRLQPKGSVFALLRKTASRKQDRHRSVAKQWHSRRQTQLSRGRSLCYKSGETI